MKISTYKILMEVVGSFTDNSIIKKVAREPINQWVKNQSKKEQISDSLSFRNRESLQL
jgi:hypothetical protein